MGLRLRWLSRWVVLWGAVVSAQSVPAPNVVLQGEVRPAQNQTYIALPHAGVFRTLSLMEVHFTPEQEAKLAQSAAQQGRNPDELVRQVVARYFEEESRFADAVKRGEEALERGEYLTHEQVGQRLERFLQP